MHVGADAQQSQEDMFDNCIMVCAVEPDITMRSTYIPHEMTPSTGADVEISMCKTYIDSGIQTSNEPRMHNE